MGKAYNDPTADKAIGHADNEKKRGKCYIDIRLKLCPFCGERPRIIYTGSKYNKWFIKCFNCQTKQGSWNSKNEAVSAWNRRDL